MTVFSSYLEKRFGFTAEKAEATDRRQKHVFIPKGQLILKQGDVPHHSYFVEKGCLRSYVTDKKGKEHIIQFAPEEWMISDPYGLLNRQPSMVFIDAVEDTEAIVLDLELFDSPSGLPFLDATRPFVNSLHATQRRLIGILSSTAEERYLEFVRAYPSLYKRLPLGMIASYIGVTPQSLSRIRKKIGKK